MARSVRMSDMSESTVAEGESRLAFRFGTYLFAFALFSGMYFVYRTESPLLHFVAGLIFAIFMFAVTTSLKGILAKARLKFALLMQYRAADYKISTLLKG